ncbi:hypothetical protein RJ641_029291 [Dillenia turbinata]|uniref:EDRF1 N-terminal domain-containing protein n=1 Tax=Dillenia turbinata TaxID=194707 RepID=A0AAN8VTE6_9MAGN
MEKPSISDGSRELQCVGRLEIVRPKPVGFLCGSIPVPTDNSFHAFNSALIPSSSSSSSQTVTAPRYRMIPTETDLNTPPLLSDFPEKVLPVGVPLSRTSGDGAIAPNLSRKGEALAVSCLAEYGDEIDVIAPADILKQIFKMPYTRGRLSIAVHRIGQTLVLNTGPDAEEGEKLVRRHSGQSKCADQSLFLNFAMHSVRMEACDCPPSHYAPSQGQSSSSTQPGLFESDGLFGSCDNTSQGKTYPSYGHSDDDSRKEGFNCQSECPPVKQDNLFWESKKNRRNKRSESVKKASQVGEKPRFSVQESEKFKRVGSDGFLRVMFWQFHNFRMLLGSDLLIFSNEKYVAVSLHLWDVSRQVTPLTWLEAWLDNIMASVPELAICYHENGVVQGYELLKTDDIFLLKGISEDGTPAFQPNVVQQNGLSVLRFLQDNCKQDPGAYWLYKSAGEDAIQLFDLSVIPKNHPSGDCDDNSSSLPSMMHRGRSDSLFSLGTLLYRIAHRLSLSMTANNSAKCARFFRKCFEFLDEPDHLVVRAFAHEEFARLILNYDEELDLASDFVLMESEATVSDADVKITDTEDESLDPLSSISESIIHENVPPFEEDMPNIDGNYEDSASEASVKMMLEANISASRMFIESGGVGSKDPTVTTTSGGDGLAICKMYSTSPEAVQAASDPISSKLTAIHHVSQAIKSLRWMRQLQNNEIDQVDLGNGVHDRPHPSINFSVCACGDADCIEICDIRQWLPTSKLDHKLWKLVLLLGESYLALGQAYKEDGQLHRALKIVELACSVYGSMPQHLEDSKFISSMVSGLLSLPSISEKRRSIVGNIPKLESTSEDDTLTLERFSSTYLFWAKTWTLVGDIYVEFHIARGKDVFVTQKKPSNTELRVSSEVVKEVKRLKKKLGQFKQNCSSCSLVNCSCQSDRASSGSSASSSCGNMHPFPYGRKQSKRLQSRSTPSSYMGDPKLDHVCQEMEMEGLKLSNSGHVQHDRDDNTMVKASDVGNNEQEATSQPDTNSVRLDGILEVRRTGVVVTRSERAPRKMPKAKNGGVFKYLCGPLVGDADYNLSAAVSCYEEARKALAGLPLGISELQSVVKKKGWACNELGRNRLDRKDLGKAEIAFADAIKAFKEVSDHTNIILINCNLGHGRRALAEDMVLKLENLKNHAIFRNAYGQTLEAAKLEYDASLKYYGAAKSELNAMAEEGHSVPSSLRNEVYTQYAHTYLRLGMLLAREDMVVNYENGAYEDTSSGYNGPGDKRAKKESVNHESSANDAIREALSVYESLGDLRKQEAAFAYFQLACYQRKCCLRFLDSDQGKRLSPKGESNAFQKVKQYASLAERNWQKAVDFYGPKTHPTMYLTILIERSILSSSLSSSLHPNMMLESALSRLLEGRHLCEESESCPVRNDDPEAYTKFWSELQAVLKKMLTGALAATGNKSSTAPQPTSSSNRAADISKLKELYKMSLKCTDFSRLHSMHKLWIS